MIARAAPALLLVGLLSGCAGAASTPAGDRAQLTGATRARTVVAVGDIACPPGVSGTATTCRQRATYALAKGMNPDRLLLLGDEQYEYGALRAFRAVYARTWGNLRSISEPVPGNHEYYTKGASGYYTYFGEQPPGYHVWRTGGWRIYNLNSNCDRIDCGAERTWLRDDLAAHPSQCSAIAMHHPRFSSGLEHGSQSFVAPFWRIAQRHGVDLALAGHDHDYERFAPMRADGSLGANGLTSFVVGTGGRSLYHHGTAAPHSQFFSAARFGGLRLRLTPTDFRWAYTTIDGVTRDAGHSLCH